MSPNEELKEPTIEREAEKEERKQEKWWKEICLERKHGVSKKLKQGLIWKTVLLLKEVPTGLKAVGAFET